MKNIILKILILIIILSQSAAASIWIDNNEVGLSPYQTSGYVESKHIIRAEHSNIKNIYIESTSIEIIYYIKGHQYIKVNEKEFYIYDKYKLDIGV